MPPHPSLLNFFFDWAIHYIEFVLNGVDTLLCYCVTQSLENADTVLSVFLLVGSKILYILNILFSLQGHEFYYKAIQTELFCRSSHPVTQS